jgi:Zn-dependent M28 family amino/carboxypeptidase
LANVQLATAVIPFMSSHSSNLSLRRQATFGVMLSLCAINSHSQPVETAPTLNAQAIRAHAEFLSNDLLEGRATGSRGYELAVAYVAAQFRQAGLAPVGDSYLQSVPLIEASVVLPGSSASLRRDGSTTNFEFSKDYLPSANFFNASSSLTAPLVFAGYGIDAPELNYNDLADLDMQGRIAVILSGAPDRFSSQARSYYGWRDTKYARLVKQGALGVIEIDTHAQKDNQSPNHWERAVAMSWVSEMRRINSDDQPDEAFPELKLKFRFNADAAALLFGNGHTLEQTLQAAKLGEPQGFALPGTMTLSATTGLRRMESNNVLGVIRGSDPRLQNEYVLVTANLDQLGRGASVNGDNIYNGLQRNAVGVAMLLEMARGIAAMPVRPKRSILFAAVTAGEKGAQGLQHLLASGPIASRRIVASVVLDTPLPIARTSDVLATGADQSSIGTVLNDAAQTLNLRVINNDEPSYSLLNESLAPLTRRDIPVLALQGGVRARAGRVDIRSLRREWLVTHRNQPSDDQHSLPLDALAARELTALNVATTIELANAAQRPTWYRNSLIHRKLAKD